ncbi:hypothetical protein [Novipirellula sp.]
MDFHSADFHSADFRSADLQSAAESQYQAHHHSPS